MGPIYPNPGVTSGGFHGRRVKPDIRLRILENPEDAQVKAEAGGKRRELMAAQLREESCEEKELTAGQLEGEESNDDCSLPVAHLTAKESDEDGGLPVAHLTRRAARKLTCQLCE
ncbi:hypothetical protein NDU88_005786 [Pleurodeles waltl]|uniref:Uncharacterized protein n=1 Tax=Pleurodeles waltl TaxID=8319 RepID=A0AAV7MD47_PLEWA|nr:hypothetical protein NDU88_005786 [Pleurodeles waltl]